MGMESPLVIVPCAGFGRRVGSPPAKELLPLRNGQPLIDQALSRAKKLDWKSVVVTRPQKIELIEYCKNKYPQTILQCIDETQDWPHTALASSKLWSEWNLLVLPDVEYGPENIWQKMFEATSLDKDVDLVVATHQVKDPKSWGCVLNKNENIYLSEKVSLADTWPVADKTYPAWGLILFRKRIGVQLFKLFIESRKIQKPIILEGTFKMESMSLDFFRDRTRGLNDQG